MLVALLGLAAVGCPGDNNDKGNGGGGIATPTSATSWTAVADPVVAELDSLVAAFEKGDKDGALASYDRAYFVLYDKDFEDAVRKHLTEMDNGKSVNVAILREEQFGAIKSFVTHGAPAAKVAAKVRELQAKLREDAKKLDDMKVR